MYQFSSILALQQQTGWSEAGQKPADFVQPYLQGFEDDHRGAWGTGGVVIQELLQFILQATEVSRGAQSLRAPVLDRAEGLRETGKLLEAIQQQTIY